MRYFEINGWKLPIEESLQNYLTPKEKKLGCIATTLDLRYFIKNKPKSNNPIQPTANRCG